MFTKAPLSIRTQTNIGDLGCDYRSIIVGSEQPITISLGECYGIVVSFEHFLRAFTLV